MHLLTISFQFETNSIFYSRHRSQSPRSRYMKYQRILLFIPLQFVLSGCFMHSSITPLDGSSGVPLTPFNKLTSLENVSGSSNYVSTAASGFRVKQSAGMITNKQFAFTQNRYRVYLHVNGRITSGE